MALRIDVISGVILILIAVAAWCNVLPLDTGTILYLGPGMLPRTLAIMLFAVGLLVLVAGIIQKGAAAEYLRISLRGPVMIGLSIFFFSMTIQGMEIAAGVTIPQLGLAVAGPIAVLIAGYASAEADFRELCATAFGFTAACIALFNDLLGTIIPVFPKGLESAFIEMMRAETSQRLAYGLYAVIAVLMVFYLPRSGKASNQDSGREAHD
jgi:hypothetical protein